MKELTITDSQHAQTMSFAKRKNKEYVKLHGSHSEEKFKLKNKMEYI